MQESYLRQLGGSCGFPRISIFISTHRAYPETEQDSIRLSNALTEAERQLSAAGVRRIDDLLSPARRRLNDAMFWRFQDHGLAVFIEEGATRWLKLPSDVAELTIVAERYHVLPLIDIFADRGRFHVLAATRDGVRFFDGGERDFEEVDIVGLPASLAEVKEATEFDADVGYHTRGRGGEIGGGAMPKYHALGESPEDYADIELGHFARDIAKATGSHLAERVAPLVLAARPRLLGRLKKEMRYGHVADADIQRDPASMTDEELHAEAWEIAAPLLRRDRDRARARLKARLEGADIPGSENLQELLRAADDGRIANLFVALDANVWGRYDDNGRKADLAERSGPENEDLLNLLALKVLDHGGTVHALPKDLGARAGPVAGLFRY